jgi:hypothetical protein
LIYNISTLATKIAPTNLRRAFGNIFSLNVSSHFGKIHIDVLRPRKVGDKGRIVKASSSGRASSGDQRSCVSDVSANSVRPRPPCRSIALPSIYQLPRPFLPLMWRKMKSMMRQ